MRKISYLAIIFATILITLPHSKALSTDNWYAYNGFAGGHNYNLKFPADWRIKELSSNEHALSPQSAPEDQNSLMIKEYENLSLEELIRLHTSADNSFLIQEEKFIDTDSQDLLIHELEFKDFRLWVVKRGDALVVLQENDEQYSEIFENIFQSIRFTDNWHQYIDFADQYAFNFPKSLTLKTSNAGVTLATKSTDVLSITSSSQWPKDVEKGESFDFNGFTAFENDNSEIVIEENNRYFLIRFGEHDDIQDILNSFFLFDLDLGTQETYLFFPDVSNQHPNANAVNTLVQEKVINGYPDGTFLPDGLINRAELTKMVVASRLSPDKNKYKNCFTDVQEQWFAPYICYAKDKGWVEGYLDGSFKPENPVNRVEAIKIILEVLTSQDFSKQQTPKANYPTDIDQEAWYINYFTFAQNNQLLDLQHQSNQKYLPAESIPRKEVAESIYRTNNL